MINMPRQHFMFTNQQKNKIMKRLIIILLNICVIFSLYAQEEKLSEMPEVQRNAAITAIAKATFQREMPEVYREYGTPTIEQKSILRNPSSYETSLFGEQYGDIFYEVTFPINKATEINIFTEGYAAKVYIWDDTQEAFSIEYGNTEGFGKILCKRDMR